MRRYLERRIWVIFLIYLVILSYFSRTNHTPDWVFMMQLFLGFEFMAVFMLMKKANKLQIAVVSSLLIILNTLLIRWLFENNGIPAFGPDPDDSLKYLSMSMSSKNLSFADYVGKLHTQGYNFDDFGMSLISWLAAVIGGTQKGYLSTLMFFNALALSVSTVFIFKAAIRILSYETSILVTMIWGLHQGFLGFCIWGLKENFFIMIVVLSIYHFLSFLKTKKVLSLIWGALFVSLTLMFRLAVFGQLIIAFGIALLSYRFKKSKGILLFIALLAIYIIIQNLDLLIMALGGVGGIEGFLRLAESNVSSYSINQQYGLQLLYAIIGSPSNFTGDIGFNHIMTFTSLLISLMTIFFIVGIVKSWKGDNILTYFLMFYWAMGVGMLVLAFRADDFRYASLYFPSFLLLSAYGIEHKESFKRLKLLAAVICVVVFVVIYFWND